jgi:hypothetical protein
LPFNSVTQRDNLYKRTNKLKLTEYQYTVRWAEIRYKLFFAVKGDTATTIQTHLQTLLLAAIFFSYSKILLYKRQLQKLASSHVSVMVTTNRQLRGRKDESWPIATLDFPEWPPTANGIGFGEQTPYLFYHQQRHCGSISSYTGFTKICACALSVCVTQKTTGRHKYDRVWSFDKGESLSNQKGYKDRTE